MGGPSDAGEASVDADISLEAAVARTAAHSPAGYLKVREAGGSPDLLEGRVPKAVMAACAALSLARVSYDPLVVYDEVAGPAIKARYKLSEADLAAARVLLSEAGGGVTLRAFSPEWIERLRPRARKRRAMRLYESLVSDLEKAEDGAIEAVLAEGTARLLTLSDGGEREEDPDPYAQFLRWAKSGTYGVMTGFRFYDAPGRLCGLGGMQPGKMIAATAPSGEGKSSLSISIIANLAKLKNAANWWLKADLEDLPKHESEFTRRLEARAGEYDMSIAEVMAAQNDVQVLYFSTENDPGELSGQVIQNLTGLPLELVTKLLTDEDEGESMERSLCLDWYALLREFCRFYGRVSLASEMAGEIAARATSAPEGSRLVVVIDHMHRISGITRAGDQATTKGNINTWYKQMFEMIHDVAKAYHVHVLALAQLDEAQRSEFRSTNDVATLKFKESGDIYNVLDGAFVFGKSRTRQMASVGWIKKVRSVANALIYDRPWFLLATPAHAELREITKAEYDALPERVIEGR